MVMLIGILCFFCKLKYYEIFGLIQFLSSGTCFLSSLFYLGEFGGLVHSIFPPTKCFGLFKWVNLYVMIVELFYALFL